MEVLPMRVVNKLSVGAALFGSVILAFAGIAQADDYHDRDRDREHHRDHEMHEHERHDERHEAHEQHYAPRFVAERPVYVAPPVVSAPQMYAPPAPSGINLNFNIPLQ
jgi:hypothetical protein